MRLPCEEGFDPKVRALSAGSRRAMRGRGVGPRHRPMSGPGLEWLLKRVATPGIGI
jgi:hypothetical protein